VSGRAVGLDVEGEVSVTTPAGPVRVTGLGPTVYLHLGSLGQARRLALAVAPGRGARRRALAAMDAGLAHARLELRVDVAGREVARLGGGRQGGWLERLLGWDPLRVSWRALPGLPGRRGRDG
jgi:hypothetical protein